MDWQNRMERVVAYIEENLCGEVDMSAAARLMESSPWEFQRVFSFIARVPVGEYIRKRRLSCAMLAIVTSDAKIIDVALRYGYDSPAAFSRAFGQQYGISPSLARSRGAVLAVYPRLTLHHERKGDRTAMEKQSALIDYEQRGYYVQENAPVYFTPDMEKTCAWFRDVLGWYGDIVGREEDGTASYGCVFDYPGELMAANLTSFRGIHLFHGTPSAGVVGFIMVKHLERLRAHVLAQGWHAVTEIASSRWGARECAVTTLDGSILRFFEPVT